MVIFSMTTQSAKARCPIEVTEEGIITGPRSLSAYSHKESGIATSPGGRINDTMLLCRNIDAPRVVILLLEEKDTEVKPVAKNKLDPVEVKLPSIVTLLNVVPPPPEL
jgi:hypothetical protein